MKGSAPKSKQNTSDLINEILRPNDDNAPTRRSNDVKDPDSIEQEMMNITIRSMALKPLEGEAKDYCQK